MSGNELKKEYGDYQTPYDFAYQVCEYLKNELNINPINIIEPTCGVGNFIAASLEVFQACQSIYGIDINKDYCGICRRKYSDTRLKIVNENFFDFNTGKLQLSNEETLIIGNPPWATNSELNYNLPQKTNFKGLSGTDAITGASNFDICEYIILKLIEEFKNKNAVIAMLCKTSVARNIFIEINRTGISTQYAKMIKFNSTKIFNINAPACLLVIKLSNCTNIPEICEVSDFENPTMILNRIKCLNGILSSDIDGVLDLEGACQLEWRQGVKHDCASVMELEKIEDTSYINKKRELVKIEDTLVFPLMKSSFFKSSLIKKGFKKYVIVTQKKARDDTSYIENVAPLTWAYLNENKSFFDNRKSSIYIGAPSFSMFGVGDYSYSKYKVGISGFYKKPIFSLLYNESDLSHPVMLDDTTYFLSFDRYNDAYTCMLLMNSKSVQDFLYSISFQDAKRPYTKKVLQRLDIKKAIDKITYNELKATEKLLNLDSYLQNSMYEDFEKEMRGK
jgi:hypothetical protein